MMKRILALAILLPTSVLAQDVNETTSYDYFDVNYVGTDFDVTGAPNLDGNGYAGRFSIEMRDHLFFTGRYQSWDYDTVAGGSTSTTLGIGSDWDFGSGRWSVFGAAGFKSLDLDLGAGNFEEEAGFIAGGARWQVANGFELRAIAEVADLEPVRRDDTTVTIGGDIYLTDVIALSVEAEDNGDTTNFLVGIRFYHGRDSDNLRQRR